MANCPEVLECYRAIWRLGAVMTPLMFLLSADEVRHAVADSGAKVLVTTPDQLDKVAIATAGLDVRLVVVGAAERDGVSSYDELAGGDEAPLADVDPTSMAALLYTGGTTGRSKGVVLSHDALSSAAWNSIKVGVTEGLSVSLLPLPMAHAFGMMVSASALHATSPGRTVLMRWFDAAEWVRLAEAERVQSGAVVPTMLRLLLSQPLEEHDLSALRRLGSGSAPLPSEVREEWARRAPHVEVVEGYGASETAAMATVTYPGRVRPGSVGEPSSDVEIRIERMDGSGDAGVDEDGEVLVRHPGLMTGYWNDPEATAAVMTDGFFRTGDVGHLDADGYLFLVDRLKDVVIRGGFNVYPRDVEEALERHPAVAVAAVVGRPDEAHGEEVVAFVQPRPGATVTPEELVAYSREHLSRAKYPREVHLVDAVPLTSIGKLDRKALRATLLAGTVPGAD
ncbi:hypothetical protein LUZ63_020494 [Rhynchospora breviuscula]|uniref:4-coumarate--CoA ligase n=1 Tax=Rhynchospora breviuscula TaxID=2022672 RepID=A0A9P9Z9I1_9POAL|nr:hypothetical protein LUZ63_020494 [Rhynchospora breviuscula]